MVVCWGKGGGGWVDEMAPWDRRERATRGDWEGTEFSTHNNVQNRLSI